MFLVFLVCCTKIKDKSSYCERKHIFCCECIPDGCYLCLFRQLQASNDRLDSVPTRLKKAFYHCSHWQLQAEANPSPFHSPRSQSSKSKIDKLSGFLLFS